MRWAIAALAGWVGLAEPALALDKVKFGTNCALGRSSHLSKPASGCDMRICGLFWKSAATGGDSATCSPSFALQPLLLALRSTLGELRDLGVNLGFSSSSSSTRANLLSQ